MLLGYLFKNVFFYLASEDDDDDNSTDDKPNARKPMNGWSPSPKKSKCGLLSSSTYCKNNK